MADNQIAGEQDIVLSANQQYIPDVDNEESNLGSRGCNIRRSWRTKKLKKTLQSIRSDYWNKGGGV